MRMRNLIWFGFECSLNNLTEHEMNLRRDYFIILLFVCASGVGRIAASLPTEIVLIHYYGITRFQVYTYLFLYVGMDWVMK